MPFFINTRVEHMAVSECPECTFHIPIPPTLVEGDILECPGCGEKLRVKSVYPPIFEQTEETEGMD